MPIKLHTFRWTLLFLCLAASYGWAETLLFEATYAGEIAGLNIDTKRRLIQLDDGSYRLESKASNFIGSLIESSHFIRQGEHWRPLKYVYRRRILGAKTTEMIEFDWDGMTAYYTHSDKPERDSTHRLTAGVLGPALYQLRLQRDLVLGMEKLDYRFVKRDRIRHYVIEPFQTETISVGDKNYSAIKMKRANADDDNKQTYVWAVPDLTYLFAKIIHVEDDGDTYQMVLTHYNINDDLLRDFFSNGLAQQPMDAGSHPSTVSADQ